MPYQIDYITDELEHNLSGLYWYNLQMYSDFIYFWIFYFFLVNFQNSDQDWILVNFLCMMLKINKICFTYLIESIKCLEIDFKTIICLM